MSSSPLTQEPKVNTKLPPYSDEDSLYLSQVITKLEEAKVQRNRKYLEFGNKTYLERYEENRKKANTILPEKKNEEDVIISAGTLEQKIEAVLSAVNNLNLSVEVRAYNTNDEKVTEAGTVMEDSIFMSEELDEDEEKKIMRQKEMLIQGEVFVEEKWVTRYKKKKEFEGKFNGQFKDSKWTERLQKCFEGPTRTVKYGPNIYLGDITQFYMKDQPFIAEVQVEGWEQTKSIFGNWEMWEYVNKGRTNLSGTGDNAENTSANYADKRWIITEINKDQCEIITYQDRWNDEFNIIINGVMMLPAGFPLSEISPNGEYTIEKQVLKVIDAHFAYGRGFIQSVEKASEILDEFLRLGILKTRKSFMPAYINTSKRVVSARVLQPGKITMGIAADTLKQIGDNSEGVTPSEFQMIKEMQDRIDKQTVSPQFAGQQGKSGTTATEVMELQRQAKMTLGLIIFACALLEKKIGYLRLWNILQNYFKPIDKVVVDGKYQNKFRKINRDVNIQGEGMGQRQIIPTDGVLPTPQAIRDMEYADEELYGFPVEKIFINPETMRNAIKKWYIVITPKEKETSQYERAMFREEMVDATNLMQFGAVPNIDALEDKFSRVYKEDKSKFFKKTDLPMPMPGEGGTGVDINGRPNVAGVGNLNNVPS